MNKKSELLAQYFLLISLVFLGVILGWIVADSSNREQNNQLQPQQNLIFKNNTTYEKCGEWNDKTHIVYNICKGHYPISPFDCRIQLINNSISAPILFPDEHINGAWEVWNIPSCTKFLSCEKKIMFSAPFKIENKTYILTKNWTITEIPSDLVAVSPLEVEICEEEK